MFRPTPATGERPLDDPQPTGEHPKGTLALLALMGILYALGWAALYVFLYLGRGPVQP